MFQILLVQKCEQNWGRTGHCLLTLLDAKEAEGLLKTAYQQRGRIIENL